MTYQVQRLGFNGRQHHWYNVGYQYRDRDKAIRAAALAKWSTGTEHRVMRGEHVVWPEEAASEGEAS